MRVHVLGLGTCPITKQVFFKSLLCASKPPGHGGGGACPGANSSMLALWASSAGPSEMQGANGQRAKLNFHHCKSHAWELKGAFGIKERCLRGLLPISSGPSSSVRWTLQDSPQPAGNQQSAVPGFLLPCLLSGHWP